MGIALSSAAAAAAHVRAAHTVAFGAYILKPGAMRDALVAAARSGANVTVTLQADPYDDDGTLKEMNADAARALRAAGAHVALVEHEREPFHLKAAVCDGVAFLDDRNWPPDDEGGLVVRDDDPRDVALVQRALDGMPDWGPVLATRKDAALRREASLIRRAGDAPLVASTESFGGGSVEIALRERARRGLPTTLIVDAKELKPATKTLLRELQSDGVVVKESDADEKFVLAGDAAWIGSANATYAGGSGGRQTDWGLITRDPAVLAALRAKLQPAGVAAGPGA